MSPIVRSEFKIFLEKFLAPYKQGLSLDGGEALSHPLALAILGGSLAYQEALPID